jgi:gamma-glutamyltranspeptidase/glutathione hydrolase
MTHGIVCAAQPEAVEAGALTLLRGGNAVDAAVACALTQGVVDPLMTGLGGVGTAIAHIPGHGLLENLNFLGAAPASATPDMWADRIVGETGDGFGFVLAGRENALGHQAVMIPGNLAGYWAMHAAHGRLPWDKVCEPAIDEAERGWMVRPHVYAYAIQDEAAQGRVPNEEILGFTQAGRSLYLEASGADALYCGELGERIVDDMLAHGGLITLKDLASYRVVHQPALKGNYRGHTIATNQPGGSGVQVVQTLKILEQFDLRGLRHGIPEHLRIVAEAIAYAYQDKRAHVGDPDHVDVPLDVLISSERAAEYARRIERGEHATLQRLESLDEPPETSQVCTLDEHGNAVSMTHTLGAPSGVMAPGTGFILNGCMGIFDPRPGHATSIAPGKSYTSSMSPSIVFDPDSALRMVLGAPGATYIPQAIAQVISNVLSYHRRQQSYSALRDERARGRRLRHPTQLPELRIRRRSWRGGCWPKLARRRRSGS